MKSRAHLSGKCLDARGNLGNVRIFGQCQRKRLFTPGPSTVAGERLDCGMVVGNEAHQVAFNGRRQSQYRHRRNGTQLGSR